MTINNTDSRRYDIDALRVFSFGTLIIYHASLLYGTKMWLLNSSDGSRLVDLIAVGSHPWRMSLLFFISGLVTASLLKKKSADEICRSRTRQLLLPFVLGVILIVPPQQFLSQFNPVPDLSYWEFWKLYIGSSFVYGLTFGHLWFLCYLWVYVLVWSILFPRIERYWPHMSSVFASWLRGANLFVLPIAFLSALRILLYPIFGETLNFGDDFYAHALYFSMFMAGTLLMGETRFWHEIDRQKWVSCSLAVASFLVLAITVMVLPREQWPQQLVVLMRVFWSMLQWCTIIALLALTARFANRPSRIVAYLNRSIMTYYVVHQTVIVIAAYYIAQLGLLDIRSFVPIVIITALTCALAAEVVRFVKIWSAPLLSRLATLIRPTGKPPAPEASG